MKMNKLRGPGMIKGAGFTAKLRDQENDENERPAQPAKSSEIQVASGGTAGSPTSRIDSGFGRVIVKEAHGGMIDEEMTAEKAASLSAAVMAKRKKYAQGGQVDIDENAEESANIADELNEDALLKENYSEDAGLALMDSPEDSNRHAVEMDNAVHDDDLISSIRRKMKNKSPIVR